MLGQIALRENAHFKMSLSSDIQKSILQTNAKLNFIDTAE